MIVEDADAPAMQSLPAAFTVFDEAAVHAPPYSRDNVRVLVNLALDKTE